MMTRAARYHAFRGMAIMACLLLLGWLGWEGFGRLKADSLRGRLLEANTADVPGIVQDMAPYRRWVDPLLRDAYSQARQTQDARKQLHASLALLPVDTGQVDYLYARLLACQAHEILVIGEALFPHRQALVEPLWALLEKKTSDQDQRFRAACALARFTSDDRRWKKVQGDVAAKLVSHNPLVLARWTEALLPVRRALLPPLISFLEDERRSGPERGLIARVVATYAADVPDALIQLENRLANPGKSPPTLEGKLDLVKKQANQAVSLMVMGRAEIVWSLLQHRPDPTLRSFLIERLAPAGVDPDVMLKRFDQESDVSVQRAILLCLGSFGLDRLPLAERQNLLPRLAALIRDHPDPGIHGAVDWLMRQCQGDDLLTALNKELATGKVQGKRQWYVNRQGQTMVLINKAGEIWLGEGSEQYKRAIPNRFAIANREVTVAQFLRFRWDHLYNKKLAPAPDCPMNGVSWYDAAAYCNWLSKQEEIPEDQWCYLPNQKGEYAEGMKRAPAFRMRTGYRLPTQAEWIHACRAGAHTDFSFGQAHELVNHYAWNAGNSFSKSHPAGSRKPNDLGLFDMHGNTWEWTQDIYHKNPREVSKENDTITNTNYHIQVGGSWGNQATDLRPAFFIWNAPTHRHQVLGFRPVRSFPD